MNRTGTFCHRGRIGQLSELTGGRWEAVLDDLRGASGDPVAAVIATVGVDHEMALPTVLTQVDLTDAELVLCCGSGVAFTHGTGEYVLPTPDGHEQADCTEHPDYLEIATVHGIPQFEDEPDLDDNDYLICSVGRLGMQYFEFDDDNRVTTCLGWYSAPEAAAEAAAGADFRYQML